MSTGRRRATTAVILPSVALVLLLASTWVIVDLALDDASTGVVSAGRTVFSSVGLALLVGLVRPPHALADVGRARAEAGAGGQAGAGAAGVDHVGAGAGTDTAQGSRPDGRRPPRIRRYTWPQLLLLALTGGAEYTMLSTAAITLAGPTLPALVLALLPAVVLGVDAVTTHARVGRTTVLATLVAVVGAALYTGSGLGSGGGVRGLLPGVLLALGAVLCQAVYNVAFAAVNRDQHGPTAPLVLPVFAVGSVPLLVWAGIDLAGGGSLTWRSLLALAVLGIVVYVPTYLLQHRLMLRLGPSYPALLGLGTPLVVGLVTMLMGRADGPGPVQILAIVITLAGMLVVVRERARGGFED